ncbi:hypothetical protein MHM98_04340 [Psychrobium sp. MM17-31]|uniref:hypothetical protein n=1 Tax=Psychrobium sp. MM17-31 TaxID=2917758 RepID=UPI001EF5C839|nr:hypothetical protein [Psychrobium sp. MM17-31]MCG7530587.1 hypothetical protein [Psychrobium sp. MM17-31]
MFILMGEAEKVEPVKQGSFDCPNCQASQQYAHHQSTAYFTVFGIKVAKLNPLENFVMCCGCRSCFDPQILQSPENFSTAIDQLLLFRVLNYLLSGYGDTIHSRSRLQSLYQEFTGVEKSNIDIDEEQALINSGCAPTLPFLTTHKYLLSLEKKHQIVIAAYSFASGSCLMEHHDRVRINTIGSSLDLSLPEIEYLIVNSHGGE